MATSGENVPENGNVASQVIATGAIGILSISRTISLAALIFAGPLNAALPTALGAFILSGALASMIISLSIAGASDHYRKVFDLLQLSSFLSIFDDEEAALAAIDE